MSSGVQLFDSHDGGLNVCHRGSPDLVRRLAKQNKDIADFVRACSSQLDDVKKCLTARGWHPDAVSNFAESITRRAAQLPG